MLSSLHLTYPSYCVTFFLYVSGDHRDLHSFPTRRSSDLRRGLPVEVRGKSTSGQAIHIRICWYSAREELALSTTPVAAVLSASFNRRTAQGSALPPRSKGTTTQSCTPVCLRRAVSRSSG